MFTFSSLGTLGRFGNQLFQIASTTGIAIKHGDECIFPEWGPTAYFKLPIPQTNQLLIPDLIFEQLEFQFSDFKLAADPASLISLHGFFQSERYFLHCEKLVRAYFEPNTSISLEIDRTYGARLRGEPTCILVVRRGDYALYPLQHPMMPAQFYQQAMEMFAADTTFFVTSDDIEWCRANIKAKRMIYLPQEKWTHNFFFGSLCQDAIISNTTFGWWIAWLNKNPNKRVIAPQRWFGPAYYHFDTSDLLPTSWITI